uniref:Uncharacterized protein n=1 Tax=Craspedostauros australis TaxID=1486917 RepID=A0A7R9ZNV8_9STRA|mmetsp:Transcript_2812/g.7784  ORF Transcript_2812/g.7784 Transcript_2812/m.7784 type:complete len:516 (+) Transcript_2812:210-1757(+)|eukprot:CAMPEP_0198113306 /NCGR_PEP_ID=MMETSP1442-20131203/5012_1 /TAXON_ID= /ORGANISM="Craspedostauros australis, Strain CCMP3328" /LENGTH=515 /DNA_ID=CAMNT_0043770365 /DNA_START=200 /DNA_END=1747 /DNA_ORIENTATION=+
MTSSVNPSVNPFVDPSAGGRADAWTLHNITAQELTSLICALCLLRDCFYDPDLITEGIPALIDDTESIVPFEVHKPKAWSIHISDGRHWDALVDTFHYKWSEFTAFVARHNMVCINSSIFVTMGVTGYTNRMDMLFSTPIDKSYQLFFFAQRDVDVATKVMIQGFLRFMFKCLEHDADPVRVTVYNKKTLDLIVTEPYMLARVTPQELSFGKRSLMIGTDHVHWLVRHTESLLLGLVQRYTFSTERLFQEMAKATSRVTELTIRCDILNISDTIHSAALAFGKQLVCSLKSFCLEKAGYLTVDSWESFIHAISNHHGNLNHVRVAGKVSTIKWIDDLKLLMSNTSLREIEYEVPIPDGTSCEEKARFRNEVKEHLWRCPHLEKLRLHSDDLSEQQREDLIRPALISHRLDKHMLQKRGAMVQKLKTAHSGTIVSSDDSVASKRIHDRDNIKRPMEDGPDLDELSHFEIGWLLTHKDVRRSADLMYLLTGENFLWIKQMWDRGRSEVAKKARHVAP